MRDVGAEGADVVIAARHLQLDGQFGVIVLDDQLPRTEQIELQAAAQASLVDVGQQRIHFGFAGQLLFKQVHVLLHLRALLFELLQADRLLQLAAVVVAQRHLFGALAFQLLVHALEPDEPEDRDHHRGREKQQEIPRQGRPGRRIARVEAAKLPGDTLKRGLEVDGRRGLASHDANCPCHAGTLAARRAAGAPDAVAAAAFASLARCNCTRTVKL